METELFLILHIDLYRLERAEEIIELELHEEPHYKKPSIMIIEWPEILVDIIPQNAIKIKIQHIDENIRKFILL